MNTIGKGPAIRAVRKIVTIVYTQLAQDNANVRRNVVGEGQLATLFLTVKVIGRVEFYKTIQNINTE